MRIPYSAAILGAAFLGATAIAGAAMADPFADAVEVFIDTGANGADPGNATGATDAAFAVLGDGGILVLRFTDNTCLVAAGNDVSIDDDADGTDEMYAVAVGLEGEALASAGVVTETSPTQLDLDGLVASFTRISLADQNQVIGDVLSPGAEIDAVQCLNDLAFGTDHITKAIIGDSDITETSSDGFDDQQFFQFEITISNPDGADLSPYTFLDTVPAEFDVVAAVADNTNAPVGGGCMNVAASEDKKGNQKLAPDRVSFDVALEAGESCTVTVDVATDDDHPGRGNNPTWTPTTCPVGGTLTLNDGVEVFDSEGNLILRDDSTLELTCTDQPPE